MEKFRTIRLLGENRIRTFFWGMLIIIPSLLFFYTLIIHFELSGDLRLIIPLYFIFGLLFTSGIYTLSSTYSKLLFGHLLISMFFMSLSMLLYITFAYIVSKHSTFKIMLMLGIYLLLVIITEIILNAVKYYNFKQKGNKCKAIIFYFLGTGIGKGAYEYVKNVYGRNSSDMLGIFSALILSVLFGFMGLFYFNKYYIVSKFRNYIYVEFKD